MIYLYARFRDAVPAALVEEFDRLEPEALSAISRSKETARREPSESKRADTSSL